jgi:hypothetical protein
VQHGAKKHSRKSRKSVPATQHRSSHNLPKSRLSAVSGAVTFTPCNVLSPTSHFIVDESSLVNLLMRSESRTHCTRIA